MPPSLECKGDRHDRLDRHRLRQAHRHRQTQRRFRRDASATTRRAVGQGLTATIRWNEDGEFQPADVIWREPYLTVLQFNDGNSFRLVLNTKNGDAVGQLIVGETGRRETGKMICKTGEVE